MSPVVGTLIGTVVVAVCGVIAKVWAGRGNDAQDLNSMAMSMVDKLAARVERLETVEVWRQVCDVIQNDHIDSLRGHIVDGLPPPPPPRPVMPPRPSGGHK